MGRLGEGFVIIGIGAEGRIVIIGVVRRRRRGGGGRRRE
jgi:hypothetical protein